MLESLLTLRRLNDRPWLAFFWGIALAVIGIFFANMIGYGMRVGGAPLSGVFTVIFILIPASYFSVLIIKKEEMLEEFFVKKHYKQRFWGRHLNDIIIFLSFFIGITLVFSVAAIAMPPDFFHVQLSSACGIRHMEVCDTLGITGAFTQGEMASFNTILGNNLMVMGFAFIFAFIFGAGAMFIIIWNASILGVVIGHLSESFWHIPLVSSLFAFHGLIEIGGYVVAGLAGSLISAAILRGVDRDTFKSVVWDGIKVLLLAVVMIVLAAGTEVFL